MKMTGKIRGRNRRGRFDPDRLKRYISGAVCVALLYATFFVPNATAQYPIGLDAVTRVEDLPLRRQGVYAGQISSSDPAGGDEDGAGFLYQQDSLRVIFEESGPGCVYRLWLRYSPAAPGLRILFYFDNDVNPTINTTVGNLFSGVYQNFLSPLVGNQTVSSGGYYCYLPLPFARNLRIALVNGALPYQITYQKYPPNTPIISFTGAAPDSVVAQWQNPGVDPKDPTGNIYTTGSVSIPPGQTQTLLSLSGSGNITGIRLSPTPATLNVLESLILRCTWDDAPTPQVECTFGGFFASSLGSSNVAALPLGVSGNEFYCYLPIPYWQSALIQIFNPITTTPININYQFTHKTEAYNEDSGYFCITQHGYQTVASGQDMTFADLSGHGQIIGMHATLIAASGLEFLHGDLRIYADGSAWPCVQGTDFDGDFNAGNYYASGPFTRPAHGAPLVQIATERRVSAYRFFLGDLIPFGNQIRISAEHGNRNTVPLTYSSVVYSYRKPEMTLMQTDELDIGDPASEAAHNYSTQGAQSPQSHYYAYPGVYDDQYFTDQGRLHFGISTFTVDIHPDNSGVRLVRRRDASVFPQIAMVRVNGDSVGYWRDPDYNDLKRWGESTFEIPADYTQGADQITVSLTNRGSQGFTEYHYKIFSHIPPQLDTQAPTQVLNATAFPLENGTQLQLQWDPAQDNIGIQSYRIYRSPTAGFSPDSSHYAASTSLLQYTDEHLAPGTGYYYRLVAIDYSGNQGPASQEFYARTSSNYLYEAELLPIFTTSFGDSTRVQNMTAYGENWSNQQQLLLISNDIGDYVRLIFQVAFPDTYDISAYFTQAPDYGVVSVKINNTVLGLPVDLYAPLISRSMQKNFGTIYLAAGTHQCTFEVAGKNSASSNYRLGLDNLILSSHYLLGVPPEEAPISPAEFKLYQNHPNPFNSMTRIRYTLPTPGVVSLILYDLAGRRVTELSSGWQAEGFHEFAFKAENLSSGMYFLVLQYKSHTALQKLLLLK
jgi:hypothetical protein